jgi:hypothetical protein
MAAVQESLAALQVALGDIGFTPVAFLDPLVASLNGKKEG